MSRNVLRAALLPGLVLSAALAGTPAQAQDVPRAEQALDAAQRAFGPPAPEPECPRGASGEIVVCAREQEQSQFRVRSDGEAENDYARETMFAGDPQAPDVAGPGIFRGPPTVGGLCIPGLQPCPRPPAITVDFAALPEAPPGSDADRIARGLPPLGNDLGDAPPPQGEPAAAPD